MKNVRSIAQEIIKEAHFKYAKKSLYKSINNIDAIIKVLKAANKNSSIKFKPYRSWDFYTSFTLDPNLNYGSYGGAANVVVFDYNKLSSLNKLIKIEYKEDFLRKHEDIFQHIIADKQSIDEYIKFEGYTQKNWIKSFRQTYSNEKEVVGPLNLKLNKDSKLKFKNLITKK